MTRRTTSRDVNSRLAAMGRPERLVRGVGYWYFVGGTAHLWPDTAVAVPNVGDLTVDQWVAEYDRLRAAFLARSPLLFEARPPRRRLVLNLAASAAARKGSRFQP